MARKKKPVKKKTDQKEEEQKSRNDDWFNDTRPSPTTSSWKNNALLLTAIVAGLVACFLQMNRQQQEQQRPPDQFSRLTDAFPVGNKVEVKNVTGMGAGVFAKTKIKKGDVILSIDSSDAFPNDLMKQEAWYARLQDFIVTALEPYKEGITRPALGQMTTVVALLLELEKGKGFKWHSYIQAMPANVTQMAWYWTEEELKCVVPRPHSEGYRLTAERLQLLLRNFHAVFDIVWTDFAAFINMPKSTRDKLARKAEWAFLMVRTRSFGGGKLLPVFDMMNHDPTKSVGLFTLDGVSHHVATRNIYKGEQVFNYCGKLFPSEMAERYGFVDPNPAYVNVPSLSQAFASSPRTVDIDMCVQNDIVFFGNVTEQRVEARMKHLHQTTYFKPFHPDQLAYQCVRVLLQTEDGATIAQYMSEKLEHDAFVYQAMAAAPHCQSEEGNFPLIREANAITARLLFGAVEVAQEAALGVGLYPGISYP